MPLKIKRRGRFWHYSGTVNGRRLRGTTGATDKAIAERIAAEIEASEWRRHLDGPGADLTMERAMLNYLDAGKPDRFLGPIAEHFKGTLIAHINPEIVRQGARKTYVGLSPATMNRQFIKPTAAVINFNAELGLCSRISVKRFSENPKKKRAATPEWAQAFAAQADEDQLPHLAALCLFMFGTAARISEACRLLWSDVDLQERTAIVRMGKPTPWSRTAHLPPAVVAALANIPSNRKPDQRVFGYAGKGSVKDPWNNVIQRSKIERLTPHCCRHGFATTLLHRGFDVKTVAERGGWKDAATVLRTYAHAIEDVTVTDALFDTELPRRATAKKPTIRKQRRIEG